MAENPFAPTVKRLLRTRRPIPSDVFSASGVDRQALVGHIRTMLTVRRGETRERLAEAYKKLNPGCPPHLVDEALDTALDEEYRARVADMTRFIKTAQTKFGNSAARIRKAMYAEFSEELTPNEVDIVLDLVIKRTR